MNFKALVKLVRIF